MVTQSNSQPEIKDLEAGVVPDVGAPLPVILADDWRLAVFFVGHLLRQPDVEVCGVIRCDSLLFKFGVPSDESIVRHDLYPMGLRRYTIQEVLRSSWIAEEFPNTTRSLRHIIATFHDSTFECVTEKVSVTFKNGGVWENIRKAINAPDAGEGDEGEGWVV